MSGLPRPCIEASCQRYAVDNPRCADHAAERERARVIRRSWYGGDWPRLAAEQVAAEPQCATCGAIDDLTADHVSPRSLDSGLRTLCRSCNSRKGSR